MPTGTMYRLSHNSTGRRTKERDSNSPSKSPVMRWTWMGLSDVTVAPFLIPPLTCRPG